MTLTVTQEFPVSLTFDIDWAPDFVLAACVDKLRAANIPATFFATHQTDLLEDIVKDPLFEIGVHPNFLPGTSHGSHLSEIMDYMIGLVPSACSMRTHGLYQSSHMYFRIMSAYPQLRHDFSLYLPSNTALQPCVLRDEKGHAILRTAYQWEDDLYFPDFSDDHCKNFIFETATYQIFDFHPIHVYLNSSDSSLYNRMKTALGKPLSQATQKEVDSFRNSSEGADTWLDLILKQISPARFYKACDLPNALELEFS